MPKTPKPTKISKTTQSRSRRINLALQGGGAHGAFTWGVLDRLLEEDWLEIEGISGASAGAMNAAILSSGLAGGTPEAGDTPRDVARRQLAAFWRNISRDGNLAPFQRAVFERLFSFDGLDETPVALWFKAWGSMFSPYDWTGVDLADALTETIDRHVDFAAINACENHHLFVSTTNVETGKLHVFTRERITPQVVMASACLPSLFRAVKLDGVPHWDGGYRGNPAIYPFFYHTSVEDVVLVQINPLARPGLPHQAGDIASRLNEINFNTPLLSEMRAIAFVTDLIDQGKLTRGFGPGEYRRINLHRITLDSVGLDLDASSKTQTDYRFFLRLRDAGRQAADAWLADGAARLGVDQPINWRDDMEAEWN
jgi:NTE family protein